MRLALALLAVLGSIARAAGGQPVTAEELAALDACYQPPAEYAGDFGEYRPLLEFEDGSRVEAAADWARRRTEIRDAWMQALGPWPALVERPSLTVTETRPLPDYTRHKVEVQTAAEIHEHGYLLVPRGEGPFPAMLVVFYEPETSIGEGENDLLAFGHYLARRGIVTLSIGGPNLPPGEGGAAIQPLSAMAYVAANCHTALAQRPEVDAERIGVMGHSYGGKWALFAACLYDKFACAVWSDPGIVFDEERANVNYWEPWYLGLAADATREPGIPSESNPRTGAYRGLVEAGRDLHELHALMAPRPLLVSGGSEDPPARWQALNHTVAVNRLLGYEKRVAMTNRPGHNPTPESNALLAAFVQRHLAKPGAD
jgi:dienelactone hydrolase